ncbi:MAG: carboxypeptidase-like regulatory domain-containing protein, partial [Candidatus Bathyarchaeota archaeon]|nr:carboxypeptidase-like regulatory domain-containing protein [Candidatus Bathyarchaeota archaeon]
DVSGVAEVTDVLIEDLQVDDMGGMPNNYKYRIVLREYTPPPQKDEPPPSQEEEAKEAVEEEAEEAKSSVNYITGKIVDGEGNPQPDVDVKITWEGGEYTLKTDAEGVYRKDNLEQGMYAVTVDAPGYEDKKEEVEIK